MSELKSVRVRKITEGSNSGTLDLKVILSSGTSSTIVRTAKAIVPSSGQTYWQPVDFQGQRYETKTDDDIISEYVSTNSELESNRIGSNKGSGLYKVVQDPWSTEAPQLRKFGEDPYYLNNGSYVMIKWKKYLYVTYEFDPFYIYGNGTSSNPTEVLIDSAIFFDGVSPSDLEIPVPNYFELYYNAASYSVSSALSHAIQQSQIKGFVKGANQEYKLNYPILNDDDTGYLFPVVGTSSFYTTEVSGYEYSDINFKEVNTPNYIFKSFYIVPRGLTGSLDPSGDIERFWSLDDKYKPRFLLDITNDVQSKPLTFEYNVKDETITSKVIETWVSSLASSYPSAKSYNLKLNSPSFIAPTENLIGDFSPKNGYGMKDGKRVYPENTIFKFEPVGSDPNQYVTIAGTGTSASVAAPTHSQFNKIPLNLQFPDNWIVKSDEAAPTFSIWVGDIEADIPVEGFVFSENGDDMSGLSPEYIEDDFAGLEEVYQEPDPNLADNFADLVDDDRGSTEVVETPSTPPSTADSGGAATNSINVPPTKPDSGKLKDIIKFACNATYSPNGNKKSAGLCAKYTFNHANNFVRTLLKKDPQGCKNPAGGNANQEGYFKALVNMGYSRSDQGTVSKKDLIAILGNKSKWNLGDVVAYWGVNAPASHKSQGGVKYGHTQIFTNGYHGTSNPWTSDNDGNYGCSFVYNRYPVDSWRFIIFKSPTATADGQKKYGVS